MINDLKDLKQLLKLCRAQGISDFEMNGLKIKFGDLPQNQSNIPEIESQGENKYSNFPQGELSEEQLIFYSSGGKPEDDPALKEATS